MLTKEQKIKHLIGGLSFMLSALSLLLTFNNSAISVKNRECGKRNITGKVCSLSYV